MTKRDSRLSSAKEYDFLVFIGRFQPLHDGHEIVIQKALDKANHVIVLVGSANTPRSARNPFTFEERATMISKTFRNHVKSNELTISPLDDIAYNDAVWISRVQYTVSKIINNTNLETHDPKVGLIGFNKDGSSYYLKKFPHWGHVEVKDQHSTFNATEIREMYFQNAPMIARDIVPDGVSKFLKEFMKTEAFVNIVREQKFIKDYKDMWSNSPYPPTFVTTDALVLQSGHILLIRRGGHPGLGQWALPGGYLNRDEGILDCVIRELKEETRISDHMGEIPPAKLRSFVGNSKVYDDPNRDPRGRTITHASLFKLPDSNKLYAVRGSDDAVHAEWIPLGDLRPETMFLDHYHIVQDLIQGA